MLPSAATLKGLIMKKLALVSLILLAAGAANAGSSGEANYDEENRTQFTSTLTRAEVKAQYAEALKSGTLPQNGEDSGSFVVNQQAGSERDVGAVRAEAVQAARTRIIQEYMV
jgi:hypothetical protein